MDKETFSSGSSTKVAVGNTSTVVLAKKTDRKYVALTNDSDETIYINVLGGTAVSNEGIRLNANGGYWELDATMAINGVNAICASGSKNLCVTEA